MRALAPAWTATLPGWVELRPLLHAGSVHVRAAGHLVAIDPSSGVERWRTEVDPANDTGRVLVECEGVIVTSRHEGRNTTLIGVDRDGGVIWETPTGAIIVDAHGVVGNHIVAFGSRGSDTVVQAVDPASGEIVAEQPVALRPDRFVVVGDRLIASRRVGPGLISMRPDGSDLREEVAEPVAQLHHQPPHLVLSTERDGERVVEQRDETLAVGWHRPIASAIVATSEDAVLVFDADDGGVAPRLLHLADGGAWVTGPALAGQPQAATVHDSGVAVQMLTTLHVLARDDLAPIADVLMGRHIVQVDDRILVTCMDRLEARELRPT